MLHALTNLLLLGVLAGSFAALRWLHALDARSADERLRRYLDSAREAARAPAPPAKVSGAAAGLRLLPPGVRTSRARSSGTLRLGVTHTAPCRQPLRLGRGRRIVARPGERLRLPLLPGHALVVHASEDLGLEEAVRRLVGRRGALERLLPPAAPRTLEASPEGLTLVAGDDLSPRDQELALRDLADVSAALAPPLAERGSLRWSRGRLEAGHLVTRRRAGPLRCAFCHDGFAEAPRACPGCSTLVHADCMDELRRCPTAGCDERRRVA